jgi:hypothetical protein
MYRKSTRFYALKQLFTFLLALLAGSFSWAQTCPCSIFKPTDGPAVVSFNDAQPIVVGVNFKSAQSGFITGIRFYKQTIFSGVHTALLYDTTTKTLLASKNFTGESASGWQQVNFNSSVAITAVTGYRAAVLMNDNHYTATTNFFTADYSVNPPLTAFQGVTTQTGTGNGVYDYTTAGVPVYPHTKSGNQANYWVDVVFGLTALPVQLTDFSASPKGNDVQLNWSTASEQQNKGFEIQRSGNGTHWNAVGFVNGAGTSQSVNHYQFADKHLAAGKYYYRLNQLDLDGHSKLSQVVQVSVAGSLLLELLQNQPNPFHGSTRIDIIVPQTGRIKLLLLDYLGRPVRQLMDETKYPGTYRVEVDRNGLSSGLYYYRLETQGQTLTRKMTIL